ncbi:MAG: hypothetical protein IPP47_00980 [Bryobacterales bacterium]|nr:hypothetical protein [Bryobacterales bacterium]
MKPPGLVGVLYRHFLAQFFENELLSPQGELRSGISGLLALAAVPGLLLPIFLFAKYSTLIAFINAHRMVDRDGATHADKLVFLTLALVIPALAALLKWEFLLPNRADHAILVPLPIRLSTILIAKASALGMFILLFALAVNSAGTILYPAVVLGNTGTFAYLGRYIAAHFVAATATSLFACLALIAIQGSAQIILGLAGFRRVSAALQFVLLTALLTLLIVSPTLGGHVGTLRLSDAADWLPPFWFLGLYEVLVGKADGVYQALAGTAIRALGWAAGLAVVTYGLSYARHFRRIPEVLERGSTLGARLWTVVERVAGSLQRRPERLAILVFMMKVFARSRAHRLLFGVFLSFAAALLISDGIGLVISGKVGSAQMLSAPLTVSFFLLTGFRFLYEIPAELPAHWAFRLAAPREPIAFHRLPLVPIAAIVTAMNFTLLPTHPAVMHTVYCLLLALVLAEALCLGFQKIPFTCTFGAAKWNITFALTLWLLAFIAYSSVTVRIEAMLLTYPLAFTVACATLAALFVWLLVRRAELWREDPSLLFQDGQAPAVQTLDLQQ